MTELEVLPPYQYGKLGSGVGQIRLLILMPSEEEDSMIVCSTSERSFYPEDSQAEPYEALSYTWGTADDICSNPILFNSYPRRISTNLERALRTLRRRDQERVLWVDALCIDQSNLLEKAAQIAYMPSIYSNSTSVIIWLGPSGQESDIAMSALSKLRTPSDLESLDDVAWSALEAFFSRPWFSRIWVLQEFRKGCCPIFYCGRTSIPWNDIGKMLQGLWTSNMTVDVRKFKLLGEVGKLVSMGSTRDERDHDAEFDPENAAAKFVALLRRYGGYHATEAHDKIYGLLGLTAGAEFWPVKCPDIQYWRPVEDVYTEWAEFLMTTQKSLEILYAARRVPNEGKLPSWVPDWRHTSYAVTLTLDIFQDAFRYKYAPLKPINKGLKPVFYGKKGPGRRILSTSGYIIKTFNEDFRFSAADPKYLSPKLCSQSLKHLLIAYLAKGCKMKNKTGRSD